MSEHEVGRKLERPPESAFRLRQPAEVPQRDSQVRCERVAERIEIGSALELPQGLPGALQLAERGARVRPPGREFGQGLGGPPKALEGRFEVVEHDHRLAELEVSGSE